MGNEQQGREAAERLRREQGIGDLPIIDLISFVEDAAGCDVAFVAASDGEHGLTMRDPVRGATFICVAATAHPMRQRSSLAHELAHVVFDDFQRAPCVGRPPTEIRADAFARHLLVPYDGLPSFVKGIKGSALDILSAVVQHYLVSPSLASIALRDVHAITEEEKRFLARVTTKQLAIRFGWDSQYHALQVQSRQKRAPQRLLSRAVKGYSYDVVSAQTIAALKEEPVESVESSLKEAGIEPAEDDQTYDNILELPFPLAGNIDPPEKA